jgi:hypothetical protein
LAPPSPVAASPKWSARSEVTRLASTAPSALTPIAPPMVRKKVSVEVAAPRSAAGTSFCAASTRFCISMPTPTPSTTMYAASGTMPVVASMVLSNTNPAVITIEPTTRYGFQRPNRVMS